MSMTTLGGKRRKIIAAMVTSLDGYIEGERGEVDWIDAWEDPFELIPQIDTCVLGGGMYPGYEQYWGAIQADPGAISPFTGKPPTKTEVEYARFAATIPHVVLSKSLRQATWPNTRIVGDVEAIRALKQQQGGDIHAVGGATLVSSLINADLVDELRVVVAPILLGAGKLMFKDVEGRHSLELREAKPLKAGLVRLTYHTRVPH